MDRTSWLAIFGVPPEYSMKLKTGNYVRRLKFYGDPKLLEKQLKRALSKHKIDSSDWKFVANHQSNIPGSPPANLNVYVPRSFVVLEGFVKRVKAATKRKSAKPRKSAKQREAENAAQPFTKAELLRIASLYEQNPDKASQQLANKAWFQANAL